MILVTNPTGRIGRIVAEALARDGAPLRILARNLNALPEAVSRNAELVNGSHRDAAALQTALAGVDTVFWCVPQNHQAEDMRAYYTGFTEAFALLLAKSSVQRVVGISSGGKGLAQKNGPIAALHAMEDMIDATGVATRFLRCGNFMENFFWQAGLIHTQGKIRYPIRGDKRMPMVAVADIAQKSLEWLRRTDWGGQKGIGVHGPEDLCFNEAAAQLSVALNTRITFEHIPGEDYAAVLRAAGSSAAFAQSLVEMFAEVEQGIYAAEPRTAESTTETTVEAWARQHLASVHLAS